MLSWPSSLEMRRGGWTLTSSGPRALRANDAKAFLRDVSQRCRTGSPSASPTTAASANTRGRARGAPADTMCATHPHGTPVPFFSEDEVTSALGHSQWSLVRRFVLEAAPHRRLLGGPTQLSLHVHHTPGATRLGLLGQHGIEAGRKAEAYRGGRPPERAWGGKCLDLSKAYKQMPILPKHR